MTRTRLGWWLMMLVWFVGNSLWSRELDRYHAALRELEVEAREFFDAAVRSGCTAPLEQQPGVSL